MTEINFSSVQEILDTETAEEFCQNQAVTLTKKNNIHLVRVIPYSIANHPIFGLKSLCIEVVDKDHQRLIVNVDALSGINSAKGIGEYEDQLLMEFYYFSPKTDTLEINPRSILVTGISFGIHPNHLGEESDFYIVGEDTQYLDRPKDERIRFFPLWRINGLYGLSKEFKSQFIKT